MFLGTLWPAYSSFKAVRTRDNQEYVKSRLILIIIHIITHQYQRSGLRGGICHHNRNSSNPPQGRWMAHWVVMAFFNASDSILSPMFIWYNSCLVAWVSDNLVSIFIACARKTALQYDKKMLRWVPGFNEARFLLLLYLVLPITRYRHVQFQSP